MDHDCDGVGREVPGDLPPNEAVTCPVCGRETKVDGRETDGGLSFTVAPHQSVGGESR